MDDIPDTERREPDAASGPLSLERLRGALEPERDDAALSLPATERRAAVAMVVRERRRLEMLLIERARRPGDPWSGQVAMPGGRMDASDSDLVTTAIRETREEVGIDLERRHWMGRIGSVDAHPRLPELSIVGHAFKVDPVTEVGPIELQEVANAYWVPLEHLIDPANGVQFRFGGMPQPFDGVLLPDGANVLWGMTRRFVREVLEQLGTGIPTPSPESPLIEFAPD